MHSVLGIGYRAAGSHCILECRQLELAWPLSVAEVLHHAGSIAVTASQRTVALLSCQPSPVMLMPYYPAVAAADYGGSSGCNRHFSLFPCADTDISNRYEGLQLCTPSFLQASKTADLCCRVGCRIWHWKWP